MSLPGIVRRAVTLALVTTPLLAALRAQADGPSGEPATPASASGSGSASASASAPTVAVAASTSTPPAPKATIETPTGPAEPPEPVKAVESDHALVVGHFGFGYFGQYATPRSASFAPRATALRSRWSACGGGSRGCDSTSPSASG
ncbi:MAG: hypothetical protein IPJ34_33085 [Myxococcales bacterium]|nr:hypothetical protein [Myxococcales bacterium]